MHRASTFKLSHQLTLRLRVILASRARPVWAPAPSPPGRHLLPCQTQPSAVGGHGEVGEVFGELVGQATPPLVLQGRLLGCGVSEAIVYDLSGQALELGSTLGFGRL